MSNAVPEWIAEAVREMDTAEESMPAPDWLEDGAPDWQEVLGLKIVQTTFPEVKVKKGMTHSPATVGAMFGHLAGFHELGVVFCDLMEGEDIPELDPALVKAARANAGTMRILLAKRKDVIERTVARAVGAPENERAEFFAAFHRGLSSAGRDPEEMLQTDTKLVFVLLLVRHQVAKFETLTAFHKWLCNLLGRNLVGNQKRIEKLCQRIGLRFRGRGRPKNQKGAKKIRRGKR